MCINPKPLCKKSYIYTRESEKPIESLAFILNYLFRFTYATFSKRFIITNIKRAERRQSTIKMHHTATNERSPQNAEPTFVR